MITTHEIAIVVRNMLKSSSSFKDYDISYDRTNYNKIGIIIVPHTIEGTGSLRRGAININIHVPNLKVDNTVVPNRVKLAEIRSEVTNLLDKHYEKSQGYNWTIGPINPPIPEENHDEHFVSVRLEIVVRNK
jgi:hypothetical protein